MENLNTVVSLSFRILVEDDWPPVSLEVLPFRRVSSGYECLASPIFIKDLSVNDIISLKMVVDGVVEEWGHIYRSTNTTIWIMRLEESNNIELVLKKLQDLGCRTFSLYEAGCHAVDVPETIKIYDVDKILEQLDSSEAAVAFPAMRHPEPTV